MSIPLATPHARMASDAQASADAYSRSMLYWGILLTVIAALAVVVSAYWVIAARDIATLPEPVRVLRPQTQPSLSPQPPATP